MLSEAFSSDGEARNHTPTARVKERIDTLEVLGFDWVLFVWGKD